MQQSWQVCPAELQSYFNAKPSIDLGAASCRLVLDEYISVIGLRLLVKMVSFEIRHSLVCFGKTDAFFPEFTLKV